MKENILRRSPRFRKNVKFYGNVVHNMSNKGCRGRKPKRMMKRKIRPATEVSQDSLLSLGELCKPKEGRSKTDFKIDDIMKLLKQRGCVLPALRCVNARTGEHQIGVPRYCNILRNTKRKEKSKSKSTVTKTESMYSLMCPVSSQTFQAEAILENLVSQVPLDPNPKSLESMNEFCTQIMRNIDNSTFPLQADTKHANNITNDDSKYQWL